MLGGSEALRGGVPGGKELENGILQLGKYKYTHIYIIVISLYIYIFFFILINK